MSDILNDNYAVFGHPIEHSRSPLIHREFAKQTGEALSYEKQLVALDGFEQAVVDFANAGGKGLNITVPFKEKAYQLAHRLSKRARQAGAVNTLIIHGIDDIEGDNTDGRGMINDIRKNLGWTIENKTILVLGAGGAVRGILGPLLAENPDKVFISNRTASKAQQLALAFSNDGDIEAQTYENLPHHAFDMIINGTSASLDGHVPPVPTACVNRITHCYDMMYSQEPTVFLAWAKKQGAQQLADGLGMLIEQAAEAFRLWRGVKPDTQRLIEKLR